MGSHAPNENHVRGFYFHYMGRAKGIKWYSSFFHPAHGAFFPDTPPPMDMIEWALLLLITVVLLLAWRYLALRTTLERRAVTLFEKWRAERMEEEVRARADLLHREWTLREEARVRRDAIGKSGAVLRGKVTEHLTPYFPGFPYDPRDARFLGTPVDLLVFDGLSSGSLECIIFIEVKTGKSGALSTREKQVRECVQKGLVRYEVLHQKEHDR